MEYALTPKQNDVILEYITEEPKITLLSGAKRAGKTYLAILMYLNHIAQYENQGLSFIIGGSTQASIRRNILNDMELFVGELKLDKTNAVTIFGNKVYCFDGANADAWKKVRGFTAAGALMNEGTALHDTFVKEVISRCSYEGARIVIDTNPENPSHSVKTDYIDHDGQRLSNGRLNIKAFNFKLIDNTFLDPEYIESIIASTPSGMFTERDIHGNWVAAEGAIYKDFDEKRHFIDSIDHSKIVKYFVGVDWGYEHNGVIVVMGKDAPGAYYLIEEHAERHMEIDYWVNVAKDVQRRYGNIIFWCDSARPEHIARFRKEDIKAKNGHKNVLHGIETVAKKIKTDQFKVVRKNAPLFDKEIFMYVWNSDKGEPVKEWDDCMDSVRYAVFSEEITGHRKSDKSTHDALQSLGL
ncbi:PBSX family phage terminase large subunit [Salicibibacter kimchii]|uniref:PBSX family phage terminase large subunit n=1 Tax=Salicibibacter kimchii TaxID=2099786 RepID=A0A345BUI4_9BACI|nr:PBSX family phage terminase large subunit [Salicibibacter kimchii]AXF54615.1 PBSX family phage terminase large subunit [Salicibibacter kimchii]